MATAIDMSTVGTNSGTPLTAAAIAVGAGVEEAITFTNAPLGGVKLVLITTASDVTYGFATGETGGKLLAGDENCFKAFRGKPLFINSAAGSTLYLRIA